MKQFTIKLNDIRDVKNFVTAVNAYTFDVDLVTGRYITDATVMRSRRISNRLS